MLDERILKTDEKRLQKAVHFLLSDPSLVRKTQSGKRLQILSPGRINVNSGPDFFEIAILLDGLVQVGDAEFHRKSSEWDNHLHSSDENYNNVILHIVIDDNKDIYQKFETLLINENELLTALESKENIETNTRVIDSLEELQHYALIRLLRKSSEAQKLLSQNTLEKAFQMYSADFIKRYDKKRRFPVYDAQKLDKLIEDMINSKVFAFLSKLHQKKTLHISDYLQTLLKTRISIEGAHLRRELLLNCLLPMAVCIADEESRIALFLWYWSTPALNKYGILSRRFEGLPQNFLWQQQGMLEYIREHGNKKNVASETIKQYGFAEMLSFYKIGKSPYTEISIDEDE